MMDETNENQSIERRRELGRLRTRKWRLARRNVKKRARPLLETMQAYAKRSGVPFELDNYFLADNQGNPCSWCGESMPIPRVVVDRREAGYVESNVRLVCRECYKCFVAYRFANPNCTFSDFGGYVAEIAVKLSPQSVKLALHKHLQQPEA